MSSIRENLKSGTLQFWYLHFLLPNPNVNFPTDDPENIEYAKKHRISPGDIGDISYSKMGWLFYGTTKSRFSERIDHGDYIIIYPNDESTVANEKRFKDFYGR